MRLTGGIRPLKRAVRARARIGVLIGHPTTRARPGREQREGDDDRTATHAAWVSIPRPASKRNPLAAALPIETEVLYGSPRSTANEGAAVTRVTLEERGRALEDQFYEKENQQKLVAMKDKLDTQRSREELRKASGMTDDAVLDKLVALGLNAKTIAALSLVPLISVAWADGEIQDNERIAILQGAHGKGLEQGTDGYELLQSWLSGQPSEELFAAWEAYIKALAGQLNEEQNRLLKNQIGGFAKMVAAAAGGILGFGKVSSSEEKVLHRIEGAFPK